MVAPSFSSVLFDIEGKEHSEYVFPRRKRFNKNSSFVSLNVIDLLMKNEDMHACIFRQVADTLSQFGVSADFVVNLCFSVLKASLTAPCHLSKSRG